MSTTIAQTPRRVTQVAEDAAAYLEVADPKKLAVAMVEIANDELRHNVAFAARIRAYYRVLDIQAGVLNSSGKGSSPKNRKKQDVLLVPIKKIEGYVFEPDIPPDPYILYELYGKEQFHTALERYDLKPLKGAVEIVQKRHPGTKPRNMGRKADIIAYLVEYVAG
jgi:hypothetical protein